MMRWLGVFGVLVILMIGSSAFADSTVTVADLKELITKELPFGSSKEQVMVFVKEHHLAGVNGEPGYSSKPNAIYGSVQNVQRWYDWETWLGFTTDIEVIFYLDSENRLKSFTVDKVNTWF